MEEGWRQAALGVVHGDQAQAGALSAPHCQQHHTPDLGEAKWDLQQGGFGCFQALLEGQEQAARFRHAPGTSHPQTTEMWEELSCHQRGCDNQSNVTDSEGRSQAQQEPKKTKKPPCFGGRSCRLRHPGHEPGWAGRTESAPSRLSPCKHFRQTEGWAAPTRLSLS